MNEPIKTQISQVISGLFLDSLPSERSELTGFILTRKGKLFERQSCDLPWKKTITPLSFLFTDTDDNSTFQVNTKTASIQKILYVKFYLSLKNGQFGQLITDNNMTSIIDWKIIKQIGNWKYSLQGEVEIPRDSDYRISVNLSYMTIVPNQPRSLATILNFTTVKLSSSEVVIPRTYIPRFVILVNNIVQNEALLSGRITTISNSAVLPFNSLDLNEIGQISMNTILKLLTGDIVQIAFIDNPSTATQGYIVSSGQLRNIREVQVPQLSTVNPTNPNQSRFILNQNSSTFTIESIDQI